MFRADSTKEETELRLETDSQISVYELLDKLCQGDENLFFKLVDEEKNLRPHVNIFIGSKNCRNLDGIDSMVAENDEVSVFPALSGG